MISEDRGCTQIVLPRPRDPSLSPLVGRPSFWLFQPAQLDAMEPSHSMSNLLSPGARLDVMNGARRGFPMH